MHSALQTFCIKFAMNFRSHMWSKCQNFVDFWLFRWCGKHQTYKINVKCRVPSPELAQMFRNHATKMCVLSGVFAFVYAFLYAFGYNVPSQVILFKEKKKWFFHQNETIKYPLVAIDVAVASASFRMLSKYKPESEFVSIKQFYILFNIFPRFAYAVSEFECKLRKLCMAHLICHYDNVADKWCEDWRCVSVF